MALLGRVNGSLLVPLRLRWRVRAAAADVFWDSVRSHRLGGCKVQLLSMVTVAALFLALRFEGLSWLCDRELHVEAVPVELLRL